MEPVNRQPRSLSRQNIPLETSGLTDTGKVRDHNEDAFNIIDNLGLFIVSDGMGGHHGGEVASKIVVEALPIIVTSELPTSSSIDEDQLVYALRQAISYLNWLVYRKGFETPGLRGMGATVVACLVRGSVAAIAHMGDSRAYLMRKGFLEQLTEDHTIVELMLQLGQLTKKEAAKHPARHTLTRCVGIENSVGAEVGLLNLIKGDRLLLCSDGLTNEVSNREIGEILLNEPDIEQACKDLVRTANEREGKDNITVLIVQYGGFDGQSRSNKKKVVIRRGIGKSLVRKEVQVNKTGGNSF